MNCASVLKIRHSGKQKSDDNYTRKTMSTTFTIIPTRMNDHVNFKNVIETAQKTMNDFLIQYKIDVEVKFKVNIHEINEKYIREVDLTDQFLWEENEYAWFTIEKCNGGIDSNCESFSRYYYIEPDLVEDWCQYHVNGDQLKWIKNFDRHWCFRRSVGQPGLINLAYGHLSAAVALLTDGLITTEDGAWDEHLFPVRAEEFLSVYFRPEKTNDTENKKWAERCLQDMLNN